MMCAAVRTDYAHASQLQATAAAICGAGESVLLLNTGREDQADLSVDEHPGPAWL
jgi:hypothetical protein